MNSLSLHIGDHCHRLKGARGTARIQCKTHPLPPYEIAYYRPTRSGVTGVIGGLMTQGRQRSLSRTGAKGGGHQRHATRIIMSALQKPLRRRAPLTREKTSTSQNGSYHGRGPCRAAPEGSLPPYGAVRLGPPRLPCPRAGLSSWPYFRGSRRLGRRSACQRGEQCAA